MSTTYAEHTLVLTHLPDPRSGAIVPVPGVVVAPDERETVIRIRDMSGNERELSVSNSLLSER